MAVSDMETVPRYIADMGERLARLEQIAEDTRRTLERLDANASGLRSDMAAEFRDVRNASRSQFLWMLGIMLSGFVGLLGVSAHGFHWIP